MSFMVTRSILVRKPFFYILFVLLVLWIILFEFILPANNFLPRPGIVLLSIPALFDDYHLIANFFETVSAVYLPPLLAFLFLYSIRGSIFNQSAPPKFLTGFLLQIAAFFPAILSGILFAFWFPESFVVTYLFSFIVALSWWMIEMRSAAANPNQTYAAAFKSLGADDLFLNKNILWNEIKPGIFTGLNRFHMQLWTLILFFEFISKRYGLGSLLQQTLNYRDLSALCLSILIITLTISAGFFLLRFIENKFIFWSSE